MDFSSDSGDSFETASGPTDIPMDGGNKVAQGREMEEVKSTVANQSTKAAKVEVGTKGRRGPPVTGSAVRARAKIVNVLYLPPPGMTKQRVAKNVPEEHKTPEYYEYRRKNTEAARRCREKKRLVDEKRMEIIECQRARIDQLEKRKAGLERENQIYRELILKLARQRSQAPKPQRPPKKSRK